MDKLLTLTVSVDEANLILGFLGDMPTKHRILPLWDRLVKECNDQVKSFSASSEVLDK